MMTPPSVLASNQRWRDRNREQHLAGARAYHLTHREEILAKKRERQAARTADDRLALRLKKFGLALEEYQALEASQGWACLVCGADDKLVIDHDHDTGRVRALLCSNCNTALGLLKESPDRIRALAAYADEAAMMKAEAVAGKPPAQ